MKKLFYVSNNDVNKCYEFGEDVYMRKASSLKQFGRTEIIRSKNDFVADQVIGKSVEIAFNEFLINNFQISYKVDFDIWEDEHRHDNGNDLNTIYIDGEERHFSYKTDIKGSRRNSQWLLVESHKLKMFHTQIYIIGVVKNIPAGNEFINNIDKYNSMDWEVEILGYILNKDIFDDRTSLGWFEFRAGDRLYSPYYIRNLNKDHRKIDIKNFHNKIQKIVTDKMSYIGPELDCKLNYGLPISWVKNTHLDWKKFVTILRDYSTPKINI